MPLPGNCVSLPRRRPVAKPRKGRSLGPGTPIGSLGSTVRGEREARISGKGFEMKIHRWAAGAVLASWAVIPAVSGAATPAAGNPATRTERDLLGEKQIPAEAYYGVQTMRALENFQISGVSINHYPGFVEAWAIVKLAAARANTDVGAMKPERLALIEKAVALPSARKNSCSCRMMSPGQAFFVAPSSPTEIVFPDMV